MNKTYLIAGATGYLGKHLVRAAKSVGHRVHALARNPQNVPECADEIIAAEATNADSLKGIFAGVDVVVSALGITRQRDGLSYDDVDFAANKNILNEAERAGVNRFGYVHVLNANQMLHVPMVRAKQCFAEELRNSSIDSTVICPSGFFSDIEEVLAMARQGR
ncbi:MAG: NAD(P)H-binding protein [Planctomycetota bacterium]